MLIVTVCPYDTEWERLTKFDRRRSQFPTLRHTTFRDVKIKQKTTKRAQANSSPKAPFWNGPRGPMPLPRVAPNTTRWRSTLELRCCLTSRQLFAWRRVCRSRFACALARYQCPPATVARQRYILSETQKNGKAARSATQLMRDGYAHS